jgi:hypothetical protein
LFGDLTNHNLWRRFHGRKNENYMTSGMCLGMTFGVIIASAFQISNLGYGMLAGLVVGMLIGMCIKKK